MRYFWLYILLLCLPFSLFSQEKSTQSDPVNLWPIVYLNGDNVEVMWPIYSASAKHTTCFPFYNHNKSNHSKLYTFMGLAGHWFDQEHDMQWYGPLYYSNEDHAEKELFKYYLLLGYYGKKNNELYQGFLPMYAYKESLLGNDDFLTILGLWGYNHHLTLCYRWGLPFYFQKKNEKTATYYPAFLTQINDDKKVYQLYNPLFSYNWDKSQRRMDAFWILSGLIGNTQHYNWAAPLYVHGKQDSSTFIPPLLTLVFDNNNLSRLYNPLFGYDFRKIQNSKTLISFYMFMNMFKYYNSDKHRFTPLYSYDKNGHSLEITGLEFIFRYKYSKSNYSTWILPFYFADIDHSKRILAMMVLFGRMEHGVDTYTWLAPFYFNSKKHNYYLGTIDKPYKNTDTIKNKADILSSTSYLFLAGDKTLNNHILSSYCLPFYWYNRSVSNSSLYDYGVMLGMFGRNKKPYVTYDWGVPFYYASASKTDTLFLTALGLGGYRKKYNEVYHWGLPFYYYNAHKSDTYMSALMGLCGSSLSNTNYFNWVFPIYFASGNNSTHSYFVLPPLSYFKTFSGKLSSAYVFPLFIKIDNMIYYPPLLSFQKNEDSYFSYATPFVGDVKHDKGVYKWYFTPLFSASYAEDFYKFRVFPFVECIENQIPNQLGDFAYTGPIFSYYNGFRYPYLTSLFNPMYSNTFKTGFALFGFGHFYQKGIQADFFVEDNWYGILRNHHFEYVSPQRKSARIEKSTISPFYISKVNIDKNLVNNTSKTEGINYYPVFLSQTKYSLMEKDADLCLTQYIESYKPYGVCHVKSNTVFNQDQSIKELDYNAFSPMFYSKVNILEDFKKGTYSKSKSIFFNSIESSSVKTAESTQNQFKFLCGLYKYGTLENQARIGSDFGMLFDMYKISSTKNLNNTALYNTQQNIFPFYCYESKRNVGSDYFSLCTIPYCYVQDSTFEKNKTIIKSTHIFPVLLSKSCQEILKKDHKLNSVHTQTYAPVGILHASETLMHDEYENLKTQRLSYTIPLLFSVFEVFKDFKKESYNNQSNLLLYFFSLHRSLHNKCYTQQFKIAWGGLLNYSTNYTDSMNQGRDLSLFLSLFNTSYSRVGSLELISKNHLFPLYYYHYCFDQFSRKAEFINPLFGYFTKAQKKDERRLSNTKNISDVNEKSFYIYPLLSSFHSNKYTSPCDESMGLYSTTENCFLGYFAYYSNMHRNDSILSWVFPFYYYREKRNGGGQKLITIPYYASKKVSKNDIFYSKNLLCYLLWFGQSHYQLNDKKEEDFVSRKDNVLGILYRSESTPYSFKMSTLPFISYASNERENRTKFSFVWRLFSIDKRKDRTKLYLMFIPVLW